jgi:hypothetical protein
LSEMAKNPRYESSLRVVESMVDREIRGNRRLLIWGALLGIFCLGFALRLYQLDADSFWSDEIITARTSQLSVPAIIRHQYEQALNPPLTFIVTRFFFECCGESEFSARLPAALLGSLSILLVYGVGARLWAPQEGLIAALLLAVSAHHVQYSQEARHYSLMLFLALLSVIFLLQALEKNRLGLWTGFVISTSLSLYNHYFAFLLLPAALAFGSWVIAERWLSYRRKKASVHPEGAPGDTANPPKQALLFSVSVVLVVVSYLPWLSTLEAQVSQQVRPVPLGISAARITSSLDLLSEALGVYGGADAMSTLLFVTLLALGLAACDCKRIVLTLLWMGTPFVFFGIVAVEHSVNLRYMLFTLPAYLLVAGRGITYTGRLAKRLLQRTHRARIWPAAVVPILCILTLGLASAHAIRTYYLREKEDWRGAAEYLIAHMQEGDLVLVDGMRYEGPGDTRRVTNGLSYYLGLYDAPPTQILAVGPQLWQDIQRAPDGDSRLWAVLWGQRRHRHADEVTVVDFHKVRVLGLRQPSGDALQGTLSMLDALLDLLPPQARFDVHLALAQTHLWTGRYAEARAELEMASRLRPESPQASRDLSLARAELERASSLSEKGLHPIVRNLGGLLALLGYSVDAGDVVSDQTVSITLRWQALAPMDKDYTVFIHLVHPDGRIWAQEDSLLEHGGLPTSTWQVGQVVTNQYDLAIGGPIASGDYVVQAGIYYWQTGDRLEVQDENRQRLTGDAIVLQHIIINDS